MQWSRIPNVGSPNFESKLLYQMRKLKSKNFLIPESFLYDPRIYVLR
jgi:hypothetical protein